MQDFLNNTTKNIIRLNKPSFNMVPKSTHLQMKKQHRALHKSIKKNTKTTTWHNIIFICLLPLDRM